MNKIKKEYLTIIVFILSFIFLLNPFSLQAVEIDILSAKDSVGTRFASKFCDAMEEGFSAESSSEFALNNTYLKFVIFPDDKKFREELWEFTIDRIKNECGKYVNEYDENNLRDFLNEEGQIASNRDLYLPQ